VPAFLSPAWVDAFNEASAGAEPPRPGPDAALAAQSGRFSVCQTVTGGPTGDVSTTLVVDGPTVRMQLGPTDQADVSVRLGWDDAVAMATGTLSVVDALAGGRIRVRGDLGVLVAGQTVLAALQERLQPLHDATTY
jgi:hypothetical protein